MLTPGRYVGAPPLEDDGIPFETKMTEMSRTLYAQMEESAKLDAVIQENLEVLGYGRIIVEQLVPLSRKCVNPIEP